MMKSQIQCLERDNTRARVKGFVHMFSISMCQKGKHPTAGGGDRHDAISRGTTDALHYPRSEEEGGVVA